MAGMFESFGSSAANPAAEIGRGIARGMQEKNARELLTELHARETLAKRFEDIEADNSYEQQAREQARNYAVQLRMLPPTDKRPKDFLPDKAFEKQLGVSGIEASPAWVRVTLRKQMKDGPKEPAEPAAPSDPGDPSAGGGGGQQQAGAPQLGAPPNFDELYAAGGAQSAGSTPQLPPMPGGEQIGPNQIVAAPAAGTQLTPPPMPDEYVSTRMSEEDRARKDAELARIKGAVSMEPDAQGNYDARALPAIGKQQTAAIALRKLGLQPDGVTPVPLEQMTPAEQGKIAHLRAQDELLDAQEALSKARITYESNRTELAKQALDIAAGNLQVKQQNANTAQSRVAMEGALYGSMLGGAGGAQGLLGGVDMGVSDPVESFTEQVLTNQLEFSAIPAKLKPLVSLKIAQRGGVIVPEKLQGKLMQFTEAKEAVDTVQHAIADYQKAEGTEAVWALYNLNSKIDGLTRIVGRALGEKGVFTDADKADFKKLMSPGVMLTLANPDRASKWVGEVNGILGRVENQQLQGFYQRVYAKKDQSLDTLRPGDQKNVVAVLDGEPTTAPEPIAQQPTASKQTIPAATYDAAVVKFGRAKVDAKYTRGQ